MLQFLLDLFAAQHHVIANPHTSVIANWCGATQVQQTLSSEIESVDAELVSYMLPLPICTVSTSWVHKVSYDVIQCSASILHSALP